MSMTVKPIFQTLPFEVLVTILDLCSTAEKWALALTCKSLMHLEPEVTHSSDVFSVEMWPEFCGGGRDGVSTKLCEIGVERYGCHECSRIRAENQFDENMRLRCLKPLSNSSDYERKCVSCAYYPRGMIIKINKVIDSWVDGRFGLSCRGCGSFDCIVQMEQWDCILCRRCILEEEFGDEPCSPQDQLLVDTSLTPGPETQDAGDTCEKASSQNSEAIPVFEVAES